MIKLHPDFKEFIKLLNKHEVKYLIIGGYAVAMHGYVRATGDLDLWVKISEDNASKIIGVLKEFGFGNLKLTKDDFLKENIVIQFGYPPFRIDILTGPEGLEFDSCYSKKIVQKTNDNIEFSFIDKDSLIINKRMVGRSIDLNDIENLEK